MIQFSAFICIWCFYFPWCVVDKTYVCLCVYACSIILVSHFTTPAMTSSKPPMFTIILKLGFSNPLVTESRMVSFPLDPVGIQWDVQRLNTIDQSHQRGQCILFSVVFTPPPPFHHSSVRLLSLYFLTSNVSPVRACLSMWLERFRGSQKRRRAWVLLVVNFLMNLTRLQFTDTVQCTHSPKTDCKQENTRLNHSDGSRRKTLFLVHGFCQFGFAHAPDKWLAWTFYWQKTAGIQYTKRFFYKEFTTAFANLFNTLCHITKCCNFPSYTYSILSLAPINTFIATATDPCYWENAALYTVHCNTAL